jgi:uncharacterized membrane protein
MQRRGRRRQIQELFDLGVGFFGFFSAAVRLITLLLEILRRDALATAITTLVMVVITVVLWRTRRAVLARLDAQPED